MKLMGKGVDKNISLKKRGISSISCRISPKKPVLGRFSPMARKEELILLFNMRYYYSHLLTVYEDNMTPFLL
jgi:hypothetical protein